MEAKGMQDADVPHYLVEWTETALIEADAAYLGFSQQRGPEYAILWYEGLFSAAQSLSSLPKAHPIAAENDDYNVTVRRLLYQGPTRQRKGNAHRILFFVIESQPGEAEGVIRILHVWHGARGPVT